MGMVTYISPRGHKRVDDVIEEVKSKLNEVDIKLSELDSKLSEVDTELDSKLNEANAKLNESDVKLTESKVITNASGKNDEENIGRVWTIISNEEKNIAKIEEGHLWK